MTLTKSQRLEAYTYAMFCIISGVYSDIWEPINDWEELSKMPHNWAADYPELFNQDESNNLTELLGRAIQQCEKAAA